MRIAMLTGGGDCPGLNAAIRAISKRAYDHCWETFAVRNGWAGMLGEGDLFPFGPKEAAGILPVGGTIIGTSRTNPKKNAEHMRQVVENMERHKLDGLIAIGGDDTLSVAAALAKQGLPVVGVPKTMDNDIAETDYCIGYDTAVNVVAESCDRLRTTTVSHSRVMVIEVMGRDAGWVACVGGMAGGADYILIPEVQDTVEAVCASLQRRRDLGKRFNLVVISEGATLADIREEHRPEHTDAFGHVRLAERQIGEQLSHAIEHVTGFETRTVVLGHLQRSGAPTTFDRVLGTRTGIAAVDLLQNRQYGYMPAMHGNSIVPVRLEDAVARTKTLDMSLYETAKIFF